MISFFKKIFGIKETVQPEVPYKVEAPIVEVPAEAPAPAPAPVVEKAVPVITAKPKQPAAKKPAVKKPAGQKKAPRKPKAK